MKILRLLIVLLKILGWALVIVVPTLGVWVASSLAAYMNGPIWLACVAGLLLFPLLPLSWDLWATKRFLRKEEQRKSAGKEPRERFVTFGDRMILRTFFLNIGFLAALLASFPQVGFTALATRGDWVLEHAQPATADQIRPVLFKTAEGLSWLYELSMDNPYEEYKTEEPLPTPTSEEFGKTETRPEKPNVPAKPDPTPDPIEIVKVDEPPREAGVPPAWPLKAELHPLVQNMPPELETDYASVAAYIKKNEEDPFLRVKALNDYVANRVAYDYPALRSGEYGSQQPKDVFDRKTAVCAGYSRLMVAMGEVTGDEIVYVTGVSRDMNGSVSGAGHAWNAAKIEGKWYLVDTTWNDGDFESQPDEYTTNYLFTPPEIFAQDHLPADDAWQLRPDPITRGEFMRQPILPPEFHAKRLVLVDPQRSQVEATDGQVTVTLKNPEGHKVIASTAPIDGGKSEHCEVRGHKDIKVTCKVPHGKYRLSLFAGPDGLTWYPFVGAFEVTSR